jgi:hypothetical protein
MTEERTKPNPHLSNPPPKPRPIVANPSTPGVQPTNRPDGRTAPLTGETRAD